MHIKPQIEQVEFHMAGAAMLLDESFIMNRATRAELHTMLQALDSEVGRIRILAHARVLLRRAQRAAEHVTIGW